MQVTRRYNARFNEEAIADILFCAMKVLGAIESIADMHEDGDELDPLTISLLEERVENFDKAIVKIWSYPLDKLPLPGGE